MFYDVKQVLNGQFISSYCKLSSPPFPPPPSPSSSAPFPLLALSPLLPFSLPSFSPPSLPPLSPSPVPPSFLHVQVISPLLAIHVIVNALALGLNAIVEDQLHLIKRASD